MLCNYGSFSNIRIWAEKCQGCSAINVIRGRTVDRKQIKL